MLLAATVVSFIKVFNFTLRVGSGRLAVSLVPFSSLVSSVGSGRLAVVSCRGFALI